jgi:hypothetical protein
VTGPRSKHPTRFLERGALAIWIVVLAATQGTAAGDPVSELLRSVTTFGALSEFTGTPVTRCLPSSYDAMLCEWQLGNRHAGWDPLARVLDSGDRVSLICELPNDGSVRAYDSCTAQPMRSNRNRWPRISSRRRESPRERKARRVALRERNRSSAQRQIDSALTLVGLSRLIGALPNECVSEMAGTQVCLWRGTARTPGHGTLAAAIGASMHKKVRMRCTLPTDGGPRGRASCRVDIGA